MHGALGHWLEPPRRGEHCSGRPQPRREVMEWTLSHRSHRIETHRAALQAETDPRPGAHTCPRRPRLAAPITASQATGPGRHSRLRQRVCLGLELGELWNVDLQQLADGALMSDDRLGRKVALLWQEEVATVDHLGGAGALILLGLLWWLLRLDHQLSCLRVELNRHHLLAVLQFRLKVAAGADRVVRAAVGDGVVDRGVFRR